MHIIKLSKRVLYSEVRLHTYLLVVGAVPEREGAAAAAAGREGRLPGGRQPGGSQEDSLLGSTSGRDTHTHTHTHTMINATLSAVFEVVGVCKPEPRALLGASCSQAGCRTLPAGRSWGEEHSATTTTTTTTTISINMALGTTTKYLGPD